MNLFDIKQIIFMPMRSGQKLLVKINHARLQVKISSINKEYKDKE